MSGRGNRPCLRLAADTRLRTSVTRRSEVVGPADPDPADPRRVNPRLIPPLQDVIELHLHVRVPEPVQPGRPVVDRPAPDHLVVQVEVAEPRPDLPRPAPGAAVAPLEPQVPER